ncbi:hypothetical protein M378DRAFT_169575 [Amanita muscaria Koide BX008]|uniref:Uncharacterized protein n=1 Tax=Amanita muscaria (strain Koide BX008) TaxID=946122 RepID=A0A0C2WR26_AMAMK|nr:hypothetical protein M378DRAFT_169575 [Amanita muscaria Koide BX008]
MPKMRAMHRDSLNVSDPHHFPRPHFLPPLFRVFTLHIFCPLQISYKDLARLSRSVQDCTLSY